MLSEAVQLELARQLPTVVTILVGGILAWLKLQKLEHTMNSGLASLEEARLVASRELTKHAVETARLQEQVKTMPLLPLKVKTEGPLEVVVVNPDTEPANVTLQAPPAPQEARPTRQAADPSPAGVGPPAVS